jgi:hypothetical protein
MMVVQLPSFKRRIVSFTIRSRFTPLTDADGREPTRGRWDIVWLVELIWYGHVRFSFEAKKWTPPSADLTEHWCKPYRRGDALGHETTPLGSPPHS